MIKHLSKKVKKVTAIAFAAKGIKNIHSKSHPKKSRKNHKLMKKILGKKIRAFA